MGTFKKGILGGFSGKVGTVVGASWRGLDVMRSLPKRTRIGASQQQVSQRQKFAAVMEFLSPLTSILASYFGSPSGTSSRLNSAASYHLKMAVIGNSPNFSIDYTKVMVSKGELVGIRAAVVTASVVGSIEATWDDNSDAVLAQATDQLLLVLYNVTKSQFVVVHGPATRADATATVTIPSEFAGDSLHAWASFVNPNQSKAATSVYLGTVVAL